MIEAATMKLAPSFHILILRLLIFNQYVCELLNKFRHTMMNYYDDFSGMLMSQENYFVSRSVTIDNKFLRVKGMNPLLSHQFF